LGWSAKLPKQKRRKEGENLKIFQVAEEEKCGGCNWRVSKLYLLADSQEEADQLYREYGDKGLCGECLAEMISEANWEVRKCTNR